jgi:dynein heavy chain 2
MLEILGQSQNPSIIQLHLKKLFSGIHTVKFTESKDKILSMMSHLKE